MAIDSNVRPDAATVPPSDALLIAAARRGDARAFEQLYRLYSARVYGLCLRMTRRRDVAEDCVQQTFIRAWRSLPAFEGRSAFGTWLHRIAVNEVLTQGRNRGSRLEVDGDAAGSALDRADVREIDAGEVMDMEAALAALPEGARHVLVLQAIYGHTHEEVAQMLGIAVGTCKAQLHRGRKLLRERLGLPEAKQ
jgi:RNA polymerase sigma-70 factor (ECF subfamily)